MNWNAFSENKRKVKSLSCQCSARIPPAHFAKLQNYKMPADVGTTKPTSQQKHYCGFVSPGMQRTASRAIINSSSKDMTLGDEAGILAADCAFHAQYFLDFVCVMAAAQTISGRMKMCSFQGEYTRTTSAFYSLRGG